MKNAVQRIFYYFLVKFRFDTAENEPAKNLQNFRKMHFSNASPDLGVAPGGPEPAHHVPEDLRVHVGEARHARLHDCEDAPRAAWVDGCEPVFILPLR